MKKTSTSLRGKGEPKKTVAQQQKEIEDAKLAEERAKAKEELRARVIAEQNERDPILTYVEELESEQIISALKYDSIVPRPEEWSNIPKLVARYCIHLEKSLMALVGYTASRSGEETT